MRAEFTSGKILAPLMKFTVPIMIALILQALYGAVDLLVVGQFASPEAVSAVATGSQVMHSMMVIITGLAMGITVLIGQQFGRGEPEKVGQTVESGVFLFGCLALVLTGVMVAATPALVTLMQAPAEAVAFTNQYVLICSGGILFIAAYNTLGSIFRGLGDARTPLLAVAIACVANIVLDLLFVAGFNRGGGGGAGNRHRAGRQRRIVAGSRRSSGPAVSLFLAEDPFSWGNRQRNRQAGSAGCTAGSVSQHFLSGDHSDCESAGRHRFRRGRRSGEGLYVYPAGALGLRSIHFRLCRAEYRRESAAAGEAGNGLRDRDFVIVRNLYELFRLFPWRFAFRTIRQRSAGDPGGRRLSESLCDRHAAGIVYVLLRRLFQRLRQDDFRHVPGTGRCFLRADSSFLSGK